MLGVWLPWSCLEAPQGWIWWMWVTGSSLSLYVCVCVCFRQSTLRLPLGVIMKNRPISQSRRRSVKTTHTSMWNMNTQPHTQQEKKEIWILKYKSDLHGGRRELFHFTDHTENTNHTVDLRCVLCNTNSALLSCSQRTSTVFAVSTILPHGFPWLSHEYCMAFLKAQGPVELAGKVCGFLCRSLCHTVSALYLHCVNLTASVYVCAGVGVWVCVLVDGWARMAERETERERLCLFLYAGRFVCVCIFMCSCKRSMCGGWKHTWMFVCTSRWTRICTYGFVYSCFMNLETQVLMCIWRRWNNTSFTGNVTCLWCSDCMENVFSVPEESWCLTLGRGGGGVCVCVHVRQTKMTKH